MTTSVFCRVPPCPTALTGIQAQIMAELRRRLAEEGQQLEVGDSGPALVMVNNQNSMRLGLEVKRDVATAGITDGPVFLLIIKATKNENENPAALSVRFEDDRIEGSCFFLIDVDATLLHKCVLNEASLLKLSGFVSPQNSQRKTADFQAETICDICTEVFCQERKPMIVCANGHSFCSNCAEKLEVCAHCRHPCLAEKIVNIALLKIVEQQWEENQDETVDKKTLELQGKENPDNQTEDKNAVSSSNLNHDIGHSLFQHNHITIISFPDINPGDGE